jgi:methylenetetrahydrofolate reductase (NADPH)
MLAACALAERSQYFRPMQLIRDIYHECAAAKRPAVSYEFFTPKTAEGDRALAEKTMPTLFASRPDYCSVTYGAGGSTRDKTLSIVDRIQREHKITAMAHLTCVGSTRAQVSEIVAQARALKIRNLLALRGDPPEGDTEFTKTEGGFEYAFQLVQLIRETGGFSIGVAGFPEGHIACKEGKQADWQRLKEKVDCGADFVITQLFFDNNDFFEFRDHLTRRLQVTVPIVPGILPILSGRQVKKFTQMCGARLPAEFRKKLDELGENDEAVAEFGIGYAARQCEDLLKSGVPGFHFYTLNKARSTAQILRNLGLSKAGQTV